MKQRLVFTVITLVTLITVQCCVSCTQQDVPEETKKKENVTPVVPEGNPKPEAGTYSFVASPLKGVWEAGDKILVHGSYGPSAQVVTLKASDISADGKTATAELGDVTKLVAAPDWLYAEWPADAVVVEDGLMESTTWFNELDIHVCVSYLKEGAFKFADASACLTFTVNGDYDKFAISGGQRPGIRTVSFSTGYSSDDEAISKAKVDGYPFRYGEITPGTPVTIWFQGGFNFKKGFSIVLGNGDNWPMVYTVSEDTKLKVGEKLDLGDITSALVAYEGSEPKMPEMGEMHRYKVDVNELSGINFSEDGSFLWGVGDGGDLISMDFEGNVLSSLYVGGDAEGITIDPRTGNLLIALEPSSVGVIEAPDFNNKVKTLFKIADAKNYGNAGMEGITYYKDGLAYCGTQTGSELYLCNIDTGEVLWKKGLREMHYVITEIADLYYDPLTDWLWVIDSEAHRFYALTGDAETLLGSYYVPKVGNAESICVDHERSCVWVGDDYGDPSYLFRFDFTGLDDAIIPAEE